MISSAVSIKLEVLKSMDTFLRPALDTKVHIYSREHHAWWRAAGSGYTTDVRDAGVYTFEDAWRRSSHCDPEKGIEYEILPEEPALPPIHPLLGDKAPRWTDETMTECGCDQCQHWFPLIEHIRSELSPARRALLDDLISEWMHQSEDLSVANAKLEGSWPGWEALKEFKPNQETA